MNRTISFVVILTTFVSSLLHAAEPDKAKLRTWKDATGKFSVQAVLVRVLGKQVVLRRTDNKEISVPIAKLSATDRQYLKDFKPSTPPNADDKTAVAALKKLGAKIEQDDQGRAVELNLSRTQITDAGLVHLKGLTNLQTLILTNTKVTDEGLVHLKELTSLQNITLPKQITDAGLVHIKELTNLKELWLQGTQLTDAGLVHLKGLTTLKELYLSSTKVTDTGLAQLSGMKLKVLTVPREARTDIGLKHYLRAGEPSARLLFSSGRITDAGLINLKGLPELQELSLFGCQNVTDAGLAHLKDLTNLQTLNLRFTQVTDAGIAELQQVLPNCKITK